MQKLAIYDNIFLTSCKKCDKLINGVVSKTSTPFFVLDLLEKVGIIGDHDRQKIFAKKEFSHDSSRTRHRLGPYHRLHGEC